MVQPHQRPIDPADMAVADNRLRAAVELSEILESLDGFTDSKVTVQLYQVDRAGKPQYIRNVLVPVEMEALADELREEYGGGDFMFKVLLNGKFKDNKAFSIAMPRSASRSLVPIVATAPAKDNMEIFLHMSNEARKDQITMMTTMMTSMVGMMTALAGGKASDPAALIASLASTMKSMQPDAPAAAGGQSMSDMLDLFIKLKELSGEGGGGDGESFLGLAGKMLPAIIEAAKANGAGVPVSAPLALAAPATLAGAPAPAAGVPDTPGHRIIGLIRDDLVYCLQRGHSADFAAEIIYGVLTAQGVTLNDLGAVIAEFSAAGDNWPAELGRHGIHLTDESQLQWFNAVTGHIGQLFSEDSQPPSPPPRAPRGSKNAANNGSSGVAGGEAN